MVGPFRSRTRFFVFTLNSLVGEGSTVAKRFVLSIVKKSDMTVGTLDAMMEVLSWSFNVALSGLSPEIDFAGRPVAGPRTYLANRWRAALVQVRGDWEFYVSTFRFPPWNGAEEMCWMCRASGRGEMSFTSCGTDANWRGTRRTHESYIEDLAAQDKELPVLLQKVQGLRLESIMVDVLHCVDLGVAAHMVGNLFWPVWIRRFGPERLRPSKSRALTRRWCSTTRTPGILRWVQGKLTVARLRTDKNWPKLKAKGAACRHLARFAWTLAQRHLEPRVATLAHLLVLFYQLISGPDLFLDEGGCSPSPCCWYATLCSVFSASCREFRC